MLKIVADENIPALERYFASFADLETCSGRAISPELVADAEVLLVRSVTKVDRALLEGSAVKFVGSATIGVDHIDTAYLAQQNIQFAHAPGSNAQSVVEYVCSAICALRGKLGGVFNKRVAIIGCGNVGSRLALLLKGLGCEVLAHDPFIESLEGLALVSLEEALAADIISLHTPLTINGPYPSYHLLDEERLSLLKPGALLINTGRGAVIDNAALLAQLQAGSDLSLVLDVWEHEPQISLELMKRVNIATPHIAGYSLDGKLAGIEMLYQALCRCFQLECTVIAEPIDVQNTLSVDIPASVDPGELFSRMIHQVYDVRLDDQRMRKNIVAESIDDQTVARQFDLLRKNYPVRREWANYIIQPDTKRDLSSLPLALLSLFKAV